MAPLAGTTAENLSNEVLANAAKWNLVNLAPKLTTRSLLVITSDDGFTAPNDALVEAIKKLGSQQVSAIHISTDHSYSDHRVALREPSSTDSRILAGISLFANLISISVNAPYLGAHLSWSGSSAIKISFKTSEV